MTNIKKSSIFHGNDTLVTYAIAYHRIITDYNNKPVDFEFLDLNAPTDLITGLKREDVVGKRMLHLTARLDDGINWIEFFGTVALSGQPGVLEHYSKATNQWYLVHANSLKNGYITSAIFNITSIKRREIDLVKKNELLGQSNKQCLVSIERLTEQLGDKNNNNLSLELNHKRYQCLVEDSNDIIYSCGLNGIITSVNHRFCEVVRQSEEEIIGRNMSVFFHFENSKISWNKILIEVIISNKTCSAEYEFLMKSGVPQYHQVTLSPISDKNSKVIEIIVTLRDTSHLKQNEKKMIALAYHDPLTGLPNRNLFLDRLNTSISTARRTETKVAVVLVDIDNYKMINKTFGYDVGNIMIKEISEKLVSCMRDYDTVARLSGEKFLLLFQNINHFNELFAIIDRIRNVLGEPYSTKINPIMITASLGISVFPDDGDKAEDILVNVDKAMYKAKEQGKNCYTFYNDNVKIELERKNKLGVMLKGAIDNREFVLHYQPQYEARTRRLRGFEALIRWNNPDVGLVMPLEFIPLAEENDLMIGIGNWVIDSACEMCSKINDDYGHDIKVSVNVSASQLRHKGFNNIIQQAILHSGINPSNLELEITERIFLENFDKVVKILKKLKSDGVRITLANFGAGNISLSQLKKIPINMVKLDKEFINEIDKSNPHVPLAESIISLVHKLNIEMLASGVENKEQFDYLIKGKCDNIQGYFFEEPVPEDLIGEIMSKGILENEVLSHMIQKAGLTYEDYLKQKTRQVGNKWDKKY